ncbi:fungal-specific transcription factor domain-containing protein [Gongronella butleri]|nr:fungal-specific transcription factor domain-containing protein [Gongronella butleri]
MAKKRGPPKGYIESLEQRLKRMEDLLGRMQPADDDSQPATPTHHGHDAHSPRSLSSSVDGERQAPKDKVVRFLGSSSGMYLVNDILKSQNTDQHGSPPPPSASSSSSSDAAAAGAGANGSGAPGVGPHGRSIASSSSTSSVSTSSTASQQAHHHNHRHDDDKRDDEYTDLTLAQGGTIRIRPMNQYEDDLVMVREETEFESKQRAVAAVEHERLLELVPRSIQEALIKIYFEYPCTTLPILDKDEFMACFQGKTDYPMSPLLICAVCSYACYLVPSDHPIFQKSQMSRNKIFDTLMDRAIQSARSAYLLPRTATVQALVLLCAHPTHTGDSYRNWIWSGMAVRMAQDLGLHRTVLTHDPTKLAMLEQRRLLWYAVYITDRWCCSAMGRPLAIADSDCDVGLPQIDVPGEPGKYGMFVNLVKLSGILGEVLRRIYSPKAKAMGYKSPLMEQTVWGLEKMLHEWFEQVPTQFRITHEQLQSMKGIEYTQLDLLRSGGPLTLCYYAVVILLFRPFLVLEDQASTPLFQQAPARCLEAARRAVDVARHVPLMDLTRFGWNFAVYSVFQSSLIHVYHCTSSDKAVARTAQDYTRIAMQECLVPITNDFPSGPPIAKFLENILVLMKADPVLVEKIRTITPPAIGSSSATAGATATQQLQQQQQQPQHASQEMKPSSNANMYPVHASASSSMSSGAMIPPPSPMSVRQIVTDDLPPNIAHQQQQQQRQQQPWDLLTLAMTQSPIQYGATSMVMTPATWQYLFSTAGTPFANNSNQFNGTGMDPPFAMDGAFMDANGPFM